MTEKKKIIPPEPGADFNFLEEIIYRRRSVRYFQKKQVPEYLIRRILETARFAPSAGNAQPWKFVVVRDQKMIEEMSEQVKKLCQKIMKWTDYTLPGKHHRQFLAKLLMRLSPNMFHPIPFSAMKLIAEEKLEVWHGAPTVIILLADQRAPGDPAIDIGIAGEHIALTAHSYGLGTCWVSFVTPLAIYRKWRKKLGIKYPYKLITSIAIGYPKGDPDSYVPRETQAIDWFDEEGNFKVVY